MAKITDVRWVEDDGGWPLLTFKLDGVQAEAHNEQRRHITDSVALHPPKVWRKRLPAITFEDAELHGHTRDPGVLQLFDAFRAAVMDGTWAPADFG